MALATCKDCNREVSTLARHCVHCGRPRPAGTSTCSIVGSVIAIVIAVALTGAVICAAKRACRKMHTKAGWECREARSERCSGGLIMDEPRSTVVPAKPEPKESEK